MSQRLHYEPPPTIETAIALQTKLRSQVIPQDHFGDLRWVAGVDVGFAGDQARAAIVILNFPDLTFQESAVATAPIGFPYIPGLLAFRELPAIVKAFEQLKIQPDLLLCDGNGYLHPRRCGSACQIGLLTGIPTIGVAKTYHLGQHEPVGHEPGNWQPIWDQDEVIGAVVRSQTNVKPIYISVGHRVSLETAIQLTLQCTRQYRLPETTRWADHLANGHTNTLV
ncbi:deoxyribonuclease V [Alkalinema pantanalense CENA528]